MAPPDKIGKLGTVNITYRRGHRGPTVVVGMPEYDFGRLQNLVTSYEEHDKAVDQLNDHPNRRTRNQMLGMLGLPLQGPHLHMEVKEYEFPSYDTVGVLGVRRAINKRIVRLTPKYIEEVVFTSPVKVTN